MARASARLDGSNVISNETSIPDGAWLGAAAMLLSILKSALSTYKIHISSLLRVKN